MRVEQDLFNENAAYSQLPVFISSSLEGSAEVGDEEKQEEP